MADLMKNYIRGFPSDIELKSVAKNATTLAEIAPMDGSLWRLCLHPFEYKRSLNPNLDQLLENGSTNPFFDTAFVAASRDRMVRGPIFQMVVWEISGNASIPRFSAPMHPVHGSYFVPAHKKTLTHPFAPFGDPVFSHDAQEETLNRFADLLKIAFADGMKPIVFDYVSQASKLHDLIDLQNFPIGHSITNAGNRASISKATVLSGEPMTSKKRKRELRRLLGKLKNEGNVEFIRATDTIDIIMYFEEFLLMETQGWKGQIGSSIHVIKKHAAFARQSVNDLAKRGLCEIFSMRFNGAPIASTIVFKSGGHYFPWKTTYDHLFSKFSPGSQLMTHLTEEIISRSDFEGADSLAGFGTSWMSHLWPDNLAFSTIILARGDAEAANLGKKLNRIKNMKSGLKKILRHT